MKALILAGGHATRLWPVTKDRAKPLLPLAGKPILDYILDEAEGIGRIDKIILTTNQKFEDSFRDYFSDRSEEKYELIVEKQETEEEKYGAIGGVINVIRKNGEDDYLVIGGDNYYSFDLENFIEFSLRKGAVTNACYQLESLEQAKNYGIVEFDEEKRIVDFEEKPRRPRSRMAATACYFFPEKNLNLFQEYTDYWEGKIPKEEYLDETGRLLQWLVERYPTYAYPFKGKWMDIGTREEYLRGQKELREGNRIEGSVENSELGENVIVLKGSKIQNSEIENSIIFENSQLVDSIVKHSLVGENTRIEKKDFRSGLLKDL